MNTPLFLQRDQGLALHRMSLERHGGLDGLREVGLLDSALMQPEAAWYYGDGDIASIAAARTFLEVNGGDAAAYDDSILYAAMIAIAEKRLDKAGFAVVFRRRLSS